MHVAHTPGLHLHGCSDKLETSVRVQQLVAVETVEPHDLKHLALRMQ